jgi:ABC-2 type transport system ATP-binding protein
MTDTAIEIHHISKRYANHTAVRDFSLTVPVGSVYAMLGPNGAGKTTIIRMILDIIAPDSGSLSILGRPAGDRGLSDMLGYLPEERGLYRKMQVRRLLRFLAALKGVQKTDADRRIDRWLNQLGLITDERDWGMARVDELSRGMQQKVQFIGALLHDPDIVILDEPFSGLDPVNAQALKDTVLDLRRRGKTVILSTHVIENAESMCDAVCIIAQGTKLLDGPLAEVKSQYGGPPVQRTVLVQSSLHDIFLQQVGAKHVDRGIHGHG